MEQTRGFFFCLQNESVFARQQNCVASDLVVHQPQLFAAES
jgi:hypothetical protein